jgi:hypothetical protein
VGNVEAHDAPDIRISGIGYGYNYLEVFQTDDLFQYEGNGDVPNFNCQVNINCPEGNDWQDQKKGVAKTIAPAGNAGYICSGTLVNNTAQDLTPYYLSAHHCFNDPEIEFDQILFYFHYESEGCKSTPLIESKTMTGAQLLVNLPMKDGSDGALLKLNNDIPADYGVYYNGWNRSSTAAVSGAGIHHPKGEIKKIATYIEPLTSDKWFGGNNPGAPDAHWKVLFTKTENGFSLPQGCSSGSPLFNQDGVLVGTLTGGTPFNCTVGSVNWYGKLWYHWNAANTVANNTKTMKDYLDPLNTGVEALVGTYGGVNSNINLKSLTVNPGALTPAFNASITTYTVSVSENVESISVSATPEDAGDAVTGTGNHPLTFGKNTIRVIVSAPDNSTSKTYTINVTRDLTSGMENNVNQPFVAYPNPARERITVSGLTGNGVLTVFDIFGR